MLDFFIRQKSENDPTTIDRTKLPNSPLRQTVDTFFISQNLNTISSSSNLVDRENLSKLRESLQIVSKNIQSIDIPKYEKNPEI